MIDEFKGMHYVDILRQAGLSAMETRRLRGDLIEVNILKEFEDSDKSLFFPSSKTELRGHSEKLYPGYAINDRSLQVTVILAPQACSTKI